MLRFVTLIALSLTAGFEATAIEPTQDVSAEIRAIKRELRGLLRQVKRMESELRQPCEAAVEGSLKYEHLAVSFKDFASRSDAYKKIASLGNDVLQGKPMLIPKYSVTESDMGAIGSRVLTKALLSLPKGKLSKIIEDKNGLHIVRVIDRPGRDGKAVRAKSK